MAGRLTRWRIVVLVAIELALLIVLFLGARAVVPTFAPAAPRPTATIPPDALRGCPPGLPGCG